MSVQRRRTLRELNVRKGHKKWQIQEAKARFSQLIKEIAVSGYQIITKNGEPVAYIVSKEEFALYLKPEKSILAVFDECPYPEIDPEIDPEIERSRGVSLKAV